MPLKILCALIHPVLTVLYTCNLVLEIFVKVFLGSTLQNEWYLHFLQEN